MSLPEPNPNEPVAALEVSRVLTMMAEPSLSCGTSNGEAYRVLWFRAFGQDPIAVRVSKSGQAYILNAKRLPTQSTMEPSRTPKSIQKQLTEEESLNVLSAVREANIWLTPVQSVRGSSVLDADGWILEARADGLYRVIARLEGEDDRTFGNLCRMLVGLAGVATTGELR